MTLTPEQAAAMQAAGARLNGGAPPTAATAQGGAQANAIDAARARIGGLQGPSLANAQEQFGSVGLPPEPVGPIEGFLFGDNDPNNQTMGEYIAELLNAGGEAMTVGLVGDEAAAGMDWALGRGSYDERLEHRRRQEDLAYQANPLLYTGTQIAGGVLGAVAAPVGTAARGAGLAARVGQSALVGGGMGATYGFMEGEGDDRLANMGRGALWGGVAGTAIPLAGGMMQRGLDAYAARRAIRQAAQGAPSTDGLRALGQAGYQQADDAGVRFNPESVRGMTDDIRVDMHQGGVDGVAGQQVYPMASAVNRQAAAFDDGLAPVFGLADDVYQGPPAPASFRDLDQLRRVTGDAAASAQAAAARGAGNAGDTRLATQAFGRVDDFVRNATAADVTAGDIQTLQEILPRTRDLWARMSRSGLIDDAIENSQNYLSGGASGLRNQFRRIVSNPRLSRGFSDAELAVMRRVAQGSIPERVLYNVGSGMGQVVGTVAGGVLGSAAGPVGTVAGGVAGAGVTGGLTHAAQQVALRNAEIARAVVANGMLRGQMPVATDTARQIMEDVMRRGVATAQ